MRAVIEVAVTQLFARKPAPTAPNLEALDEIQAHPPDLAPFIRESIEERLGSHGLEASAVSDRGGSEPDDRH